MATTKTHKLETKELFKILDDEINRISNTEFEIETQINKISKCKIEINQKILHSCFLKIKNLKNKKQKIFSYSVDLRKIRCDCQQLIFNHGNINKNDVNIKLKQMIHSGIESTILKSISLKKVTWQSLIDDIVDVNYYKQKISDLESLNAEKESEVCQKITRTAQNFMNAANKLKYVFFLFFFIFISLI